jgi:shikimate 5-dehydrogenase
MSQAVRNGITETGTMYFIGVSTSRSSIMNVFPVWAAELGLPGKISGMDLAPNDAPERYRDAVRSIKEDPKALGALVTTHKLTLFEAAYDLFDEFDEYAQMLREVSSISKRGNTLRAHAKDPITSGLALESILDPDHWKRTGGEVLLLGAGGAALALTLYLHQTRERHASGPARIAVHDRSERRLREMEQVHGRIGMSIPVQYRVAEKPSVNDDALNSLPEGSLVCNATGLGKDASGSPITDDAVFPRRGIAWDFNYRGDLRFLEQAARQKEERELTVEDGWRYFIYGWTRVMEEVFDIPIPTTGPQFERLCQLAADARR